MDQLQAICLLLSLALFCGVEGHVLFQFPIARSQDSGIKGPYPCGPNPFWGPGQNVTTLAPGPITLRWGETVNHNGAPFRLALSPGSDQFYDQFILYDHIPHNDAWNSSYGFNNPKPYEMTVIIPNIDCPQCSLQLLEIMTDKLAGAGASCCTYPNNPTGNETAPGTIFCPSVYHSCANVKITGTIPVSQYHPTYKGPCGPYSPGTSAKWIQREGGNWWLANPDYVPGLKNTCPGWNRDCVLPIS